MGGDCDRRLQSEGPGPDPGGTPGGDHESLFEDLQLNRSNHHFTPIVIKAVDDRIKTHQLTARMTYRRLNRCRA